MSYSNPRCRRVLFFSSFTLSCRQSSFAISPLISTSKSTTLAKQTWRLFCIISNYQTRQVKFIDVQNILSTALPVTSQSHPPIPLHHTANSKLEPALYHC
ncbi:hypothetical protein BsWGS_25327 [Bradybaena similaris]